MQLSICHRQSSGAHFSVPPCPRAIGYFRFDFAHFAIVQFSGSIHPCTFVYDKKLAITYASRLIWRCPFPCVYSSLYQLSVIAQMLVRIFHRSMRQCRLASAHLALSVCHCSFTMAHSPWPLCQCPSVSAKFVSAYVP